MTAPKKHHPRPAPQAKVRKDDGNAFLPDPEGGPGRTRDRVARELAKEFLASATSGEEQGEERQQRVVPSERGGPFVPSTAKKEFGYEPDASNPPDAEKAPFPITHSKRRQGPRL
jgi:hypothetical protein